MITGSAVESYRSRMAHVTASPSRSHSSAGELVCQLAFTSNPWLSFCAMSACADSVWVKASVQPSAQSCASSEPLPGGSISSGGSGGTAASSRGGPPPPPGGGGGGRGGGG